MAFEFKKATKRHRGKRGDFWSKVDKTSAPDGCWPWTGSMGSQGYGEVRVNKRLVKAHRHAWELANEPIPEGLVVCHRCDNTRCCRPDHLFLGTQRDNIADMLAKGRNTKGSDHIWSRNRNRAQGERNGRSKLTADQVREIRALWQTGEVTKMELGRRFGVTDVLIRQIVQGAIWRNVG